MSKPPRSGRISRPDINTGPPSRRRLRRLAKLAQLPTKLPEKIEEGIERGLTGAAGVLRDPVGTAQKVIDTLQAPRGLVLGWAIALLLPILLYVLDLGSGSLWHGDDVQVASAILRLARGEVDLRTTLSTLPMPLASPLGLSQMAVAVRLLGPSEAALRLVPVLAALGCAMCLLAVAIDVGLGRHVGGLAGLVLLALPVTYELSHRVLPDLLVAVASTGAVALVSHSLHGHKFDRHILPIHKEAEEPEPLPLRRLPMLFAALGIGAAATVDPRAGLTAILFALLDMLMSHRYLLRKRRVWLMLLGGAVLTWLAATKHPHGARAMLSWNGTDIAARQFMALWHQGTTWYGRHAGAIAIVTTGFGLLLGSMRRASRPLLCWVVVAAALSSLGQPTETPQGLGLLLPPLALAAAVGLQSPVRWLGSLGGIVTAGALAGIVMATIEGDGVLHKNDTLKLLAESQRHAPRDAKLCSLAIPKPLLAYYAQTARFAGSQVEDFPSVDALRQSLAPGQPFSCLVPSSLVPLMNQAFASRPPTAATPTAPPPEPRRASRPAPGRPAAPATASRLDAAIHTDPLGSVLATTIDIEEPPPDIAGPKLVLITR